MTFVLAILLICFVGCVWVLVCNEITMTQRLKIIDSLSIGHESFWRLHDHFDAVSYDRHLAALAMFRNPWKLYHPDLVNIVKERKK